MVEVSADVFVGTPNRRVRERIWELLSERVHDDRRSWSSPPTTSRLDSPHRRAGPLVSRGLRRTRALSSTSQIAKLVTVPYQQQGPSHTVNEKHRF
ncbi:type I-E CRISPR-associated endoribonuclease Cas2 [Solihabitans fulvus]|uniref:type I-E CRISPR-associated endoribonuclease Cas2 n=1 Tax=Solihabitans fulvus TaxID=1892852 RepID=UPI001CB766D5